MAEKSAIRTDKSPAAIGPYSQAVRAGELVFVSGQIPLDASGAMVPGSIREQTGQVIQNIGNILAAAGLSAANVVRTTVFLKDMNDFATMNAVYATFFAAEGLVPPARSTVEVSRLPKDVLVEMDVIAHA